MATLHDLIVHFLNLEASRKLDWLPEIPEDIGEEITRFTDDKLARKQLRLLANSAVEVLRLRAEEENHYADLRHGLRRVRRMNSRASAVTGTSRLLRLYDFCMEEYGQDRGTEYNAAAQLADSLLMNYNGWAVSDTYHDAASYYTEVVGSAELALNRQKLVNELLTELKKLES